MRSSVDGTDNQYLLGMTPDAIQESIKKRKGGLTVRSKTFAAIVARKQAGNLPEDEEQALKVLNPQIASYLNNVQVTPAVRIGRQFSTEARPAQPAIPAQPAQEAIPFADPNAGAFADNAVPGFEAQPQGLFSQEARAAVAAQPAQPAVPASFNARGATLQALKEGNTALAKEYAAFDEATSPALANLSKTQFQRADKLRDEHTKLSKTFIDVRDAYGRIIESGTSPSAAGDLSLIFNYMKMLDPDSVVRESEFATAANSAGVPARIRAQYNRLLSGERLASSTRLDFISRSKKLYDRQLKTQRQLDGRYGKLATKFGVPSDVVVQNFALEKGADNEVKLLIGKRSTKPTSALSPSEKAELQRLRAKHGRR